MMPQGGRREKAGRKPVLDDMARLGVGARCERLWREEQKSADDRSVARHTEKVRLEWDRAAKIPMSERPAWLRSSAFRDYQDDVLFAVQEQLRIPEDSEPP